MNCKKSLTFVSDIVPDTDCLAYCEHFQKTFSMACKREPDYPTLFLRLLDPAYQLDFLVVDVDHVQDTPDFDLYEFIDTVRTLISSSRSYACGHGSDLVPRQTRLIAMVGLGTSIKVIRQIQRMSSISALTIRLGPGVTYQDIDDAVRNFIAGENILPPKIAQRLRGKKKLPKSESDITLTPRQSQILDLINTRGSTNKVIAKTLKISESTVKLHMSAILKKYGCRNRTQLAVFSSQGKNNTPPQTSITNL
jgi:DNA-binding CsgD family transcriptional regulator